jgi:hypothetical protein
MTQHQSEHVERLRAERQAQGDLVRALSNRVPITPRMPIAAKVTDITPNRPSTASLRQLLSWPAA